MRARTRAHAHTHTQDYHFLVAFENSDGVYDYVTEKVCGRVCVCVLECVGVRVHVSDTHTRHAHHIC